MSPRDIPPTGKGSSLLALPQAPEVGWVPTPTWAAQALGHPVSSPPQRSRSACGSVAAAWCPLQPRGTRVQESSTPTPSREAAALSSPGK